VTQKTLSPSLQANGETLGAPPPPPLLSLRTRTSTFLPLDSDGRRVFLIPPFETGKGGTLQYCPPPPTTDNDTPSFFPGPTRSPFPSEITRLLALPHDRGQNWEFSFPIRRKKSSSPFFCRFSISLGQRPFYQSSSRLSGALSFRLLFPSEHSANHSQTLLSLRNSKKAMRVARLFFSASFYCLTCGVLFFPPPPPLIVDLNMYVFPLSLLFPCVYDILVKDGYTSLP